MNRFRAVIDDSSQFSLRSLLWLDHCEGSCVLAIEQVHESLFPRVSNQPRVIGQKPDWLPVDPAVLNVNMKSTLAAKLWNSEVTGWWQVDGIGSGICRPTCR